MRTVRFGIKPIALSDQVPALVYPESDSRCDDLALLEPEWREVVESVVDEMQERGHKVRVHETWRHPNRGVRLAERGASRNGARSMHCHSLAADLVCGSHWWSCEKHGCRFYYDLGDICHARRIVWGGDWSTLRDLPHIQAIPLRAQDEVRNAETRDGKRGIMMRYLAMVLTVLALLACSPDKVEQEPRLPTFPIHAYPIDVVYPANMEVCQIAALYAGVAYLEAYTGRNLARLRAVSADDVAVHGMPSRYQVGASTSAVSAPNVRAEANLQLSNNGSLHSVDLRLSSCDAQDAAHELAHSLLGSPHASAGLMRLAGHEWGGPL